MKIRTGHVSNSSSSSFILDTNFLSAVMVDKIFNHIKVAQTEYDKRGKSYDQSDEFGYAGDGDGWNIKRVGKDRLAVATIVDNFDMDYFFKFIGVPKEAIIEEDDSGYNYICDDEDDD